MCTYKWTQDWTEQIKVVFQGKAEWTWRKGSQGGKKRVLGGGRGSGQADSQGNFHTVLSSLGPVSLCI